MCVVVFKQKDQKLKVPKTTSNLSLFLSLTKSGLPLFQPSILPLSFPPCGPVGPLPAHLLSSPLTHRGAGTTHQGHPYLPPSSTSSPLPPPWSAAPLPPQPPSLFPLPPPSTLSMCSGALVPPSLPETAALPSFNVATRRSLPPPP
jgi:hypothetical protein